MKRWTLWLIVAVMVIAFVGLLYLQVNYISTVFGYRNDQFDTSVAKALDEVNRDVERYEMAKIIQNRLDLPVSSKKQPYPYTPGQPLSPNYATSKLSGFDFKLEQLPKAGGIGGAAVVAKEDRVLEVSQLLLEQLSVHYEDIKDLVIDLAMKSLTGESSRPIYERVSGEQLDEYITQHMADNGITLPCVYEVVDRHGRIYFSTGKVPKDNGYSVFTHVLFSTDNPSQYHFLKVFFPGKRQFISGNIDFLIPSIGFSIMLFLTFLFTIVNLFRQKKLEEMRSDFINNMTHELKTPVSSIKLGVQMLHGEDISNKKVLNTVEAETERLILLIDKVLQMSFFGDEEKVKISKEVIDVEELMISVSSIFSLKLESFGGEIDVDLNAEETEVLADKMHLTNIIFNLMDNALKYRNPSLPPMLSVGTYNVKNNICIYIQDNGIGIKKEYLKKIFDRFFRVPTGNRHDVRGFGLGLAYVARMVRAHGGDIKAESDLGKGTKFIITLPLTETGNKK